VVHCPYSSSTVKCGIPVLDSEIIFSSVFFLLWFTPGRMFYPHNPVYVRRTPPSVLVFSLSSHRHPSGSGLLLELFFVWFILLRYVNIGRSRVGSTPRGETDSVRTLSSVSCVHTPIFIFKWTQSGVVWDWHAPMGPWDDGWRAFVRRRGRGRGLSLCLWLRVWIRKWLWLNFYVVWHVVSDTEGTSFFFISF
jgi:hypothetical protein